MKTILAAVTVAILATGCATQTPVKPVTAGEYCKGQATLASNRANMTDRPLFAANPSDNIADAVYKDCLVKVTVAK